MRLSIVALCWMKRWGEAARIWVRSPSLNFLRAGSDPSFDKRLTKDCIENEPLYLVMAGIVAVDTGAPAALALVQLHLG